MRTLFILAFFAGLSANALTINLRGTVSNGDGDPLSGAIVTLLGQNLKDTTGLDGAYALMQTTPVLIPPPTIIPGPVTITGNMLEFSLSKPSQVTIEVFDIKSNLLKSEKKDFQEAGVYRWDISKKYTSNQLLIVRASIGGEITTFRYIPLIGRFSENPSVHGTSPVVVAKAAAVVDSLEIKAAGYISIIVNVESYDETVDVRLSVADRWGGIGNPPVRSVGCGKSQGITSGKKTIRSNNQDREYIIDIPDNYDEDMPHIIIYTPNFGGGTPEDVRNNDFYFLKTFTEADNKPTVFIAPLSNGSEGDHTLFEDLMAYAEENLCIDTTRIFVTGFSYGGMVTYSLSTNHQYKIRAASGLAPANYNIWLPDQKLTEPIAWMQTTGMNDNTCPWINSRAPDSEGSKFIALEKAADNGCDIPPEIPTWQNGEHICYEFEGCDEGYPVKICTSGDNHTDLGRDPGSSEYWIPPETWEFFMRF